MPIPDKATRRRRSRQSLYRRDVHGRSPIHTASRSGFVSRGALLAGTSMIALMLIGADGAQARPFGMSTAVVGAPTIASDAATAAAQQAIAVARQSQSALTRATQAIQALQAVQAAARGAAAATQRSVTLPQVTVPNGLAPGGLQVAPGAVWSGANAPTQSTSGGQTSVTVNQTAPQAILNWQTFNVGAQTTLTFNQQGNASWTALNRVIGNLGPSQILGNIKADGQVLVINQNGIIFGGASQINVGSLIASSANITDQQFLTKGIYSTQSGSSYLPSFTGAGGKIIVENGALITTNAPASVTSGGGFVALLGTEVDNAGSITTPSGQAMLAAGDDFILRPGYGTNVNQYSTTRGNEVVPVLYAGSSSGTVSNTGLMFAQQGDITLAGHAVIQDGILVSTTSVNQRGTIHLLNSAGDATGSVTLTADSISLILPELGSGATALNSKRDALIAASGANGLANGQFDNLSTLADRQDQSRVEIVTGGLVDFKSGSLTMAQGGQVAVSAGKRVFAESGSVIDVSGTTGTVLPMSANDVLVNIQGNELRDSPQNRDNGNLFNQNVWIDVRNLILVPAGTGGYATNRYYTAGGLLEVSGYLNNTGHTIGEWTAVGGTITLAAPQVVAQQGSTFNISGGSVRYQGGYVPQTYLLGSDGRIYNINSAPTNLTYLAVANGFVVTHSVGGKISPALTQVYLSPFGHQSVQWQDGYTVGRDAGSLILSTPTAIFEGSILATVIDGERQVSARPAGVTDGYKLTQNTAPLAGTLALGQYSGFGLTGAYSTDVKFGDVAPVTGGLGVTDALPTNRSNTAWFDAPSLTGFGLGGLNVATAGKISVDAPLTLAAGGQITFAAPAIALNADVTAHGGSITLGNIMSAVLASGQPAQWWALTAAGIPASVSIGSGVTVDLSGLWTNALTGPDDLSGLAYLNGGRLTVSTTGGITLASGSLVDVSSGGAILANGKTQGGTGGSVSLISNDYSHLGATNYFTTDRSAPLVFDGSVRAYGFNGGGTLTINAGQSVLIGADASLAGGTLSANTPAVTSLRLSQAVVIPTGGIIPANYSTQVASVPLDIPTTAALSVVLQGYATITTGASWVVPAGLSVLSSGPTYQAGQTVPAGTTITQFYGTVPVGTVLPSAVFTQGLGTSGNTVVTASYAAGDVARAPLTLPQGTLVPAGATFATAVAVQPVLTLSPDLFASGFSHYAISGGSGLAVGSGVDLSPVVPVYRFTNASYTAPTGSAPSAATDLWLPPATIANPLTATLTRRAGADLTLASLADFTLQPTAAITVDAGQSVTILANGQTTIDGNITAPGGAITVNSVIDAAGQAQVAGGTGNFSLTRSVWIGENAVLDVSGRAVVATDMLGRSYGTVTDGGSIMLGGTGVNDQASDAFIVIRPGARLEASGASAMIDLSAGLSPTVPSRPTLVASNGGSIGLYSNNGMILDGIMHAAAGGPGASGGTLMLDLVSRLYSPQAATFTVPNGIGQVPVALQQLRNITIVQTGQPSGLAADLAPGAADPALQVGTAVLGVDQVHAGGFDALSLRTSDLFVFKGDVNLAMGRSLVLSGGIMTASPDTPGITVALSAPYVSLGGSVQTQAQLSQYTPGIGTNVPGLGGDGNSFSVSADLIDIGGDLRFGAFGSHGSGGLLYLPAGGVNVPVPSFNNSPTGPNVINAPGFGQITLQSAGDVRLGSGNVYGSGNLTIQAAQVYPLSGASATLYAGLYAQIDPTTGGLIRPTPGMRSDALLTIRGNGGPAPAVPASAFGQLTLFSTTIDQGGVVRAPLGIIAFNVSPVRLYAVSPATSTVIFRAGSITSTSADGLTMPFGGTADGVTYQGAGTFNDLGAAISFDGSHVTTGLMITANTMVGEAGAVLDLAGGGNLTGAGFISGRGGSVDVLATSLINANPANTYSAAGNTVYAIVPGYASAYAPLIASNGAGNPGIGQQVTIGAGVPGLPAGTYTLLPSSYALLPGAYRVEIGATNPALTGAVSLNNGSYVAAGVLGVANTGIRNALASQLVITPGQAVRSLSQYNEMGYSAFAISQAAVFGGMRPRLPMDAGVLLLNLAPSTGSGQALSFNGTALFNGAAGGIAGTLMVQSSSSNSGGILDITAPGAAPVAGHISVASSDLNAFNAGTLVVGGTYSYYTDTSNGTGPRVFFNGNSNVNILDGAVLNAGQVFVTGLNINVAGGATIDTRGRGGSVLDSTLGYLFSNTYSEAAVSSGPSVLAVANGWLNFLPVVGTASMTIASGASLLTDGSVVLAAPGSLTMGDVNLGAKYLTVSQNQINVGSASALAAAQAAGVLPAGWTLDQATLDKLLRPSTTAGAASLQQLALTTNELNFFGTATLDTTGRGGGQGVQLVINTPAIYGLGGAGDTATIITDKLIWNGIRTGRGATGSSPATYASLPPPVVQYGGAGTGSGQLTIQANTILFGYGVNSRPTDGASLDRLALGFSVVNLNATQQITANSDGTLSVGLSRDATGALQGGALNLVTPLVTATNGASLGYKAGGAVSVTAPIGMAPAVTAGVTDLGGTVSFKGDSVFVDTAVALPSGKLTLSATNAVELGSNATIDLAGRSITFFDVTKNSWGGSLVMQSANGGITQDAGSLIDVSAVNNAAGSISANAINGTTLFNGSVLGGSTGGYASGSFSATAQTLGDFAALNGMLNAGGVFGSRAFDIRQGDLVVGSEVKAHSVTISVDGGSLTVNGMIDASGSTPGAIRLAARDNLELTGSAVLDAHGTVLQVDSYGQPIIANNRGTVELTTSQGTLLLDSGARIDVSVTSPQGKLLASLGQITLNAPRTGETSGDVKINAVGPLAIRGAQSVAVNAFWIYSPTDAYGTIVQDNGEGTNGSPVSAANGWLGMNQVDQRSLTFINAALANSDLQGRLAGLTAYGAAFHLRPGVEIDGTPTAANPTGTLTVAGDLDLSGFRYGPNADRNVLSPTYGAGEPGALVIRASGNLDIVGSISDGFKPAPATPDDNGWLLQTGVQTGNIITLLPIVLSGGTTFPNTAGVSLRYDIPIYGATIAAYAVIPTQVSLSAAYTVLAGTRLTGAVSDASGNLLYPAGTLLTSATVLPAGSQLGAGSLLPGNVNIQALLWPAGASLGVFTGAVTLSGNATVPFEGMIPSGTNVQMGTATAPTRPSNATSGMQGSLVAIAPPLAPGSQSWSMRLVSGADLAAADTRAVQPASVLKASGVSGNLTLTDSHVSTSNIPKYFYIDNYGNKYYKYNLNDWGCRTYGCTLIPFSTTVGPVPSVVRTGTGNLDIVAGGSFSESTLYGVYTAGTQTPAIAANGSTSGVTQTANPYNAGRTIQSDGTVLGALNTAYELTLNPQRIYYADNGGDLLLTAQGDIGGYLAGSNGVADWLLRQGGPGQATAWGINYGSYAFNSAIQLQGYNTAPGVGGVSGFVGVGTLGGGNVTLTAGRDIGNAGQGIVVAVGGSGRVLDNGNIITTGGGTLTVTAGRNVGTGGNQFVNLRGNTSVDAGSFGTMTSANFGYVNGDPRPLNPLIPYGATAIAGGSFAPGDGSVTVRARGDLAMGTIDDPGRVALNQGTDSGTAGVTQAAWFTLWTGNTAVDMFAAGGDLAPLSPNQGSAGLGSTSTAVLPSILRATAAGGSIYLLQGNNGTSYMAPSPSGELDLLARGMVVTPVNGNGYGPLATSLSAVATPLDPGWWWRGLDVNGNTKILASNYWDNFNGGNPFDGMALGGAFPLFTFGATTVTDMSAFGAGTMSRIYAVNGDIINLVYGEVFVGSQFIGGQTVFTNFYRAVKPVQILAGGDIVNLKGMIMQGSPTDVSVIGASGNIIYAGLRGYGSSMSGLQIAGPGTLAVVAGKSIYQGSTASIEALSSLVPGSTAPVATISLQAGVGSGTPGVGQIDYTGFAARYLDPANAADPSKPLADQPGKAMQTADTAATLNDLTGWLKSTAGYTGDSAGALAFFNALPAPQRALYPTNALLYSWLKSNGYTGNQGDAIAAFLGSPDLQQHYTYNAMLTAWLQVNYGYTGNQTGALGFFRGNLSLQQQAVFDRMVYLAELTASGREYTDSSGPRAGSYLRGRDAIAALFPSQSASGQPLSYRGDITMFSALDSRNNVFSGFVRTGSSNGSDGGAIELMAPGGQVALGTEGLSPGANAGLITLGQGGDIGIYSLGSILLGQSRIMTTYGGNITAWSATGDINAGRGSKTTTIYTPPQRVYDFYGNVQLSPVVPVSGAGIATIQQLSAVNPGNIDLIAPLGTIDVGEAGVRVSGNINLAALQVINAANIQVQGTTSGLPVVSGPPIAALTSANNVAGASQQATGPAQPNTSNQPSVIIVEILGYGGGDGGAPSSDDKDGHRSGQDRQSYNTNSVLQLVGNGTLSDEQKRALTDEERNNLTAQ